LCGWKIFIAEEVEEGKEERRDMSNEKKKGNLFKCTHKIKPSCDGQHGYRVPFLSIVKKTSVSEQHAPLSPKNLITLALTLNIARSDLNHQSMSSTKQKLLVQYTPTRLSSKPSQFKDRNLFCSVRWQHLF
jgi:hypothetical protein